MVGTRAGGAANAHVQAGLKRHKSARWRQMLSRASHIDRMVKGMEPGNPWDELLQLSLFMAGVLLFRKAS